MIRFIKRIFTKKIELMTTEDQAKTSREIVTLTRIAKLLTPMAQELHSLTGRAPAIAQVLSIEYEIFDKAGAIRTVVDDLTPDGWQPSRDIRSFPYLTDNQIAYRISQGRIAGMGKILNSFSPKKWEKLIRTHLEVSKKGICELPKKAHRRISEANMVTV